MDDIESNDSKLTIKELISQIVPKRTALEKKRETLKQEIQEIDSEISFYDRLVELVKSLLDTGRNQMSESQNRGAIAPIDLLKKGKYAYMTVPAALVCFFNEQENEEAAIPDIYDYLNKNGLEIGGKDPLANLTAVLHADGRFETVRRGIYQLKPEVFQNLKESGFKLRFKIEEDK
ncbi:MAG: hypothetical protein ABR954_02405 [Dehalococcoidales bacterium]